MHGGMLDRIQTSKEVCESEKAHQVATYQTYLCINTILEDLERYEIQNVNMSHMQCASAAMPFNLIKLCKINGSFPHFMCDL